MAGLDETGALQLLEQVRAWHSHALFDLHNHLVAHPDAFRSGASGIPASLVRLIWALHDAGHPGVVTPSCVGCGRAARELPATRDGGRVCLSCYRQANKTACARCGRLTKAAYRRPEGIICASCRDAETDHHDQCVHCG